jgi:hypothetical protein
MSTNFVRGTEYERDCSKVCAMAAAKRPLTAYIVQEFLAENKMAVVPHPPCSPYLAPSDFILFPKMKIRLKG